jgi:hypothetical protein
MAQYTKVTDSLQLREHLMAAEPMHRVVALYALERELARNALPPGARLAQSIEDFVARGMPFYSSVDPHYLAWVEQAVQHWERLQRRSEAVELKSMPGERRSKLRPAAAQG